MSIRYCPRPGCHRPYYVGQTCHGYQYSQGLPTSPALQGQILRAEIAEERYERAIEAEVEAEIFEEVVEDIFFGDGDGSGW